MSSNISIVAYYAGNLGPYLNEIKRQT